jgi:hypothetical protein
MSDSPLDRRTVITTGLLGLAAAVAQPGQPSGGMLAQGTKEAVTATLPTADRRKADLEPLLKKIQAQRLEPEHTVVFPRSSDAEAAWTAVKAHLRDLSITSDGQVTGTLLRVFKRIDSGLTITPEEDDTHFSPFHIEPLVDQAADLFDRAVRDRATWDDLSAKALTLLLELKEYADVDEIHRREEQAGIYDVEAIESEARRQGEMLNGLYQNSHSERIGDTLTSFYSGQPANDTLNAGVKLAWLSGLVPYTWRDQVFVGYSQHTYGGVTKTVADHAYDGAGVQWNYYLNTRIADLFLQQAVFNAARAISDEQLAGITARHKWEAANSAFRRERTVVARRYQDIKTKAATEPDGLLNYAKRLPALKERFEHDVRHGFARLTAVAKGMRDVYGYDQPLPDAADPEFFDQCLLWSRETIQWLIRFSRQDQSVVWTMSVRDIVGDQRWRDGLNAAEWHFDVPASTFPEMRHLRLRGVSAAIEGIDEDDGTCQVIVRLPQSAVIQHMNGEAVPVDQSIVPPTRISRVTVRTAHRQPDVMGVVALHNASPIGAGWHVRIADAVPKRLKLKKFEDLQLDVHLTYRDAGAYYRRRGTRG